MATFTLFNLPRGVFYESVFDANNGLYTTTTPMSDDLAAYVQTPLASVYMPVTYSFAFQFATAPSVFSIYNTIETLADLVNAWNAQAIKFGNHTLAMSPDYTDASYVCITNTLDMQVHLWTGPSCDSYFGAWEAHETRRIAINDFAQGILSAPFLESPIIVTNDLFPFEATAYLYRRKANVMSEYYTKNQTIIIPAGFYQNIHTLVAVLNANIHLRGERNGFIFNFITDGKSRIGVEATHRQPEPSVLTLKPLLQSNQSSIFNEHMSLPLRTSKRMFFTNEIDVIM
jgi:hypothetical protein